MSAETEHNKQLDLFSLKVKQKLEDHRLPVDAGCWERIEAEVAGRPRPSTWRIGGWISAVAAVLALLLVIRLYQPDSDLVPAFDAGSQKNEQVAERTNPEKKDIEKQQPEKGNSFAIPPQVLGRMVAYEEIRVEVEEVELPDKAEVAQPEVETPGVRHRGPEPEKHRAGNLIARADRPKAKDGKWQIGASMGTGGHFSLGMGLDNSPQDGMVNEPQPGLPLPPGPSVDEKPDPDVNGGPETFSHVDCAPPLSFGLMVRKNLNDRIGLESGLVYTYLYSKMNEGRMAGRRATLGLHYLGIPVNLVVKLWDHPDWNVYLSGGFMVEKGLRSVYHVEAYGLHGSESATSRSGIGGLQWSLNLSIGVAYRFYRDWSLYLEPRYSYYFDNNQPVSYRTENTTLIGVGAGVRFEF